MKKLIVLCLLILLPALALAQGAVLLVEMPDNAQMVEDVAFDDGDFIQTYQIGGATVQLVRYGAFEMTLSELIESEWTGSTDVRDLGVAQVSGHPASGAKLCYAQDGQTLDVTLMIVDAGGSTLVFTAAAPQGDGEAAKAVQALLDSMQVQGGEAYEETEVG